MGSDFIGNFQKFFTVKYMAAGKYIELTILFLGWSFLYPQKWEGIIHNRVDGFDRLAVFYLDSARCKKLIVNIREAYSLSYIITLEVLAHAEQTDRPCKMVPSKWI